MPNFIHHRIKKTPSGHEIAPKDEALYAYFREHGTQILALDAAISGIRENLSQDAGANPAMTMGLYSDHTNCLIDSVSQFIGAGHFIKSKEHFGKIIEQDDIRTFLACHPEQSLPLSIKTPALIMGQAARASRMNKSILEIARRSTSDDQPSFIEVIERLLVAISDEQYEPAPIGNIQDDDVLATRQDALTRIEDLSAEIDWLKRHSEAIFDQTQDQYPTDVNVAEWRIDRLAINLVFQLARFHHSGIDVRGAWVGPQELFSRIDCLSPIDMGAHAPFITEYRSITQNARLIGLEVFDCALGKHASLSHALADLLATLAQQNQIEARIEGREAQAASQSLRDIELRIA